MASSLYSQVGECNSNSTNGSLVLSSLARSSCGTREKVLESWDSDSSESLGMSET